METQPLHDVFRAQHPLREDYTCQNTSRIDMIFVSSVFTDRLLRVKHKSLDGIVASDHKMVTLEMTLHRLIQQPLHHIIYKKPKGYKFLLRDASNDDWENFENGVNIRIGDGSESSTMGLRRAQNDDEKDLLTPEDLQRIDIDLAWK
ncbi:hypothetical protein BX616_008251, partial [Lobosporangium transversale]